MRELGEAPIVLDEPEHAGELAELVRNEPRFRVGRQDQERDMTAEPSEREYQRTVMELLSTLGWRAMHVFPLMDKHGVYRTPTTTIRR